MVCSIGMEAKRMSKQLATTLSDHRSTLGHSLKSLPMIFVFAFMFTLCALWSTPMVAGAAEDLRPLFYQANQSYEAGEYAKAIDAYQEILNKGQTSGHVYYNLGNAYYRIGQKGQALVNYLRARQWIPRDPDLRANLEHVRADLQLTDESEGLIAMLSTGMGNMVNLREIAWIASLILTIGTGLVLIQLFLPRFKDHVRIPLIVVAVLFGAILVGVGFSAVDSSREIAIVVAKEVTARFEPSESGGAHFTLKEGNRAAVDTTREGWILLQRSDGKKGWVKAEEAEPLQVVGRK